MIEIWYEGKRRKKALVKKTNVGRGIDLLNENNEYLKTVQFTIDKKGTINNVISISKDNPMYNDFEKTMKPD